MEHAVDTLTEWLWSKARAGALTNYTEAGAVIGLDPQSQILWGILGEISTRSFYEYEVMLSVIVVNQKEGYPGASFFTLAEELHKKDIDEPDRLPFFCSEVQGVFRKANP